MVTSLEAPTRKVLRVKAQGHKAPRRLRELLLGPRLAASQLARQRISPVEGLSALSLDALTSVAYGPQAILVVLATAGLAALHLIVPITVAIVVLLAILVISYRQVITAYPGGGGAYAVSRDNFGPKVSQLAAAALVVDYTLTVAVSITSGIESLVSAFPVLAPGSVGLCLGVLTLLTLLNLRGLGDTARAFLLPTMVFIVGLLAVIAVGVVHPLAPHIAQPGREVATRALATVGVLLVLKAFSAGCSALTGVEAIANGVPLFKDPKVARAKHTEVLLGVILGAMLLGLAVLAHRFAIEPSSSQTVLSEIMAASVGRSWAYYVMSITITVVLALAANTSFGGLPVLGSLLARDNYLPHSFALRDDRLTFGTGIWALTAMSAALIVAVDANTNNLIPLFAIGVFIGFTLAQAGLVVHWRRSKPPGWRRRSAINGLGAAVTAAAAGIFLVTKFTEGAWVVVIAIPTFVLLFRRIEAYYSGVARLLRVGELPGHVGTRPTRVVVPFVNISTLTQRALCEARSLSSDVTAITVAFEGPDSVDTTELERRWQEWDPGARLVVLRTEYASIVDPIASYVFEVRREGVQVVVLIPVVKPPRLRHRLLHNHIDRALTRVLSRQRDVIVARILVDLPAPFVSRGVEKITRR